MAYLLYITACVSLFGNCRVYPLSANSFRILHSFHSIPRRASTCYNKRKKMPHARCSFSFLFCVCTERELVWIFVQICHISSQQRVSLSVLPFHFFLPFVIAACNHRPPLQKYFHSICLFILSSVSEYLMHKNAHRRTYIVCMYVCTTIFFFHPWAVGGTYCIFLPRVCDCVLICIYITISYANPV